ncbi:MAG: DNA gyrase inhibitor YacG [Acidobacteriota bacterium]|nr:DNA gyrase inhibitor YacG [Acidobacteriota bacterium]
MAGTGPLCVYCRRQAVDPRWRPFCSERCKLLDLSRWVDGTYRVPGEPVPEPEPGAGRPPDA